MSKAVMISIQPKWCELICSGKKTVEVRKTKPKLETPFKCYIYCTMRKDLLTSSNGIVNKPNEIVIDLTNDSKIHELNGKVIGEFVCDEIISADNGSYKDIPLSETGLQADELLDYANDKRIYGWHISDLVIYDKPRELSEFRKICQSDYCHTCDYAVKKNGYLVDCDRSVKRPPQSWGYVENLL